MNKTEVIVWRGTDGDSEPVRCTAEVFGYPHMCKTPDGSLQKMYDNTHFLDIEDAWQSLLDSATAGVRLSGSQVTLAKELLRDAEKMAGDDCERYCKVSYGYREFQREQQEATADEPGRGK